MEPHDLNQYRSIEELVSVQKEVRERITDLNTEFEGVPFPDEIRSEVAGLDSEDKEIERRVQELKIRHEMVEGYAQDPRKVERMERDLGKYTGKPSLREQDIYDISRYDFNPNDWEGTRRSFNDGAMRAIEIAQFPHRLPTQNREDIQAHVERMLNNTQQSHPGEVARHLLATGGPVYRSAFWKYALSGNMNSLTPGEQRALSTGATTGGQAVPFTLDPTVIPTSNSVVNPARALGRNVTISGSNTWNGVSSGAITAARAAEAAVTTDNSPTMAAPTATVTKAQAFVPFSVEIQEDWGALEAEMGRLFQDAKDDEEATAFVTGAGSGVNPQGFVTGTTTTVAASTGLTVTAANLYALEAALPPRFRPNESFVANRGIYNVVRGIDTAGGAALWLYVSQGLVTQSPTPGNTGATLLGRGAWEASQMQATVVNATKIVIVGDFSYFLVLDRLGMNIQPIPFLFGAAQGNLPTGQAGIYAWWRNTSKVLSASAFVALTGTT
ncbi:MAG TPA: phage major capsid protein [Candidatus Acidoferrum sp.]|nr:phage major capsid protein [Candidatus Acidoferrum sp.]